MTRTPGPCIRDLQHRFGPSSGWCLNGCGWRDDGKSAYRPEPVRRLEPVPDITEPLHPKEHK